MYLSADLCQIMICLMSDHDLFEQAVDSDSDSDTELESSEFGQTQQVELVQY